MAESAVADISVGYGRFVPSKDLMPSMEKVVNIFPFPLTSSIAAKHMFPGYPLPVNGYKKVSQVPKSLGNFFYSVFDGYSWETASSIKD